MSHEQPPPARSWAGSDRAVPRLLVRPLREFLDTEMAGGVVLLAATVVALVWANSPWREAYSTLWATEISVRVGDIVLAGDVRHWVNDGAMALFFFVVGLELKRELVEGDLAQPRDAALPVIGALGGMVVPALVYVAFNAGEPTVGGWGVPMATDIAFALGVLYLLGPRVPSSVRVFLLSLAIVDDVGTIVVIALFYSGTIDVGALLVALAGLGVVVALRRLGVWWVPAYALVGVAVWLATMSSGVNATMAGVALGLLTPVHPLAAREKDLDVALQEVGEGRRWADAIRAREATSRALASVPVTERLEHVLHPWTSFFVVPLFALANAGIQLDADALAHAVGSPVARGVAVGRVLGKPLGITLFVAGAAWLGLGRWTDEVRWTQLVGLGTVAAVGFTVPLFVSALAFDDAARQADVKVAMLAASLLGALLGATILARVARRGRRRSRAP